MPSLTDKHTLNFTRPLSLVNTFYKPTRFEPASSNSSLLLVLLASFGGVLLLCILRWASRRQQAQRNRLLKQYIEYAELQNAEIELNTKEIATLESEIQSASEALKALAGQHEAIIDSAISRSYARLFNKEFTLPSKAIAFTHKITSAANVRSEDTARLPLLERLRQLSNGSNLVDDEQSMAVQSLKARLSSYPMIPARASCSVIEQTMQSRFDHHEQVVSFFNTKRSALQTQLDAMQRAQQSAAQSIASYNPIQIKR